MTNRTVAARYARALFEANAKGENLRQVEVDLTKIHDVIAGHDTLSRVLTNPVISVLQKRAIVVAILSRLKRILSTVNKLATLLAERDRLGLLPDILQIFRAKLREHFGVVEAQIITAQPLSRGQLAELEGRLANASGKEVSIVTNEDPTILGGIIARSGTTVYDASLASHLGRMRNNLMER